MTTPATSTPTQMTALRSMALRYKAGDYDRHDDGSLTDRGNWVRLDDLNALTEYACNILTAVNAHSALLAACRAAEEVLAEVDASIEEKRHDLGIIVSEGVMYREGKASDSLGWSHIRDWKTKRDAALALLQAALTQSEVPDGK